MNKEFLEKYMNSLSPTGYENESQQLWIDYMKQYVDEIKVDNYGSAIGVINTKETNKKSFNVVIEAHVDEVSYRVKYITDNGYLYVTKNGGSDHIVAPSKVVNIHSNNGIVRGFFGWPAIHTRTKGLKEVKPSIDNIFIDCGADKKSEVLDMGIDVGSLITYPDKFNILNDKYYNGKALDNKLGGYIISQVTKELTELNIDLPYTLNIVNSVQEEVGLRGAKMVAESIKPDVAIVIDMTHDTHSPQMSKTKYGDIKCGKGPVLSYGPTIQQKLIKIVEKTAIDNNIDFQRKASNRTTGTDADSFAYSVGGIPTVLISLPVKYMHTTVETSMIKDVESIRDLIILTLQNIEYNHNFKYLTV